MSDTQVVKVQVRAIFPTNSGVAVFLGNEEKVFVIYVDPAVGSAIALSMRKVARERPQTHELIGIILQGLGARVDRVFVNDFHEGVYFGRLILVMTNEVEDKQKIVEIDCRPSDCIALALQQESPIYVSQAVWEETEDMSDILAKMEDQQMDLGSGEEPGET